MFRIVPVSWVNLGFAGDCRQNLKTNFAQVPEQSEFTYSAYLVAAGHLYLPGRRTTEAHYASCPQGVLSSSLFRVP